MKSNAFRHLPAAVRLRSIAVVLLATALAAPAFGQSDKPEPRPQPAAGNVLRELQNAFAEIAEKVSPSVVAIQSKRKLANIQGLEDSEEYVKQYGDRLVPSVGSGIIIDPSGLVLTNEHVVYSSEELVVVMSDRRRYRAQMVASDGRSDLAVIKIDTGGDKVAFKAARLADLSTVRQGHWAVAMGNAFGLAAEGKPAMTVGIVSAIGRVLPNLTVNGDRYYGNLIQTSADINPGNSGGPLLNIDGEVIGINTAISSRSGVSEGVGFAIPITDRTRSIIDTLRAGNKIEYGFLGVVVRSPGRDESTRNGSPPYVGAVIDMVERNTPASDANLRVGDVIIQVDDVHIEDSDHLVRTIGSLPVGRKVKITIWRDRKEVNLTATLKKRSEMVGRWRPDPIWMDWRGMRVGTLTDERRKELGVDEDVQGVEVISVTDGSAAKTAGIRPGDVLDQLDRKPVRSLEDFRNISESIDGGKDIYARLVKGGLKLIQGSKPKE